MDNSLTEKIDSRLSNATFVLQMEERFGEQITRREPLNTQTENHPENVTIINEIPEIIINE